MLKLYYSPGACSLASHIALRESGLDFGLVKVDLKTKKTETGADYFSLAKRGKVPALDIGEAELLTETPAILQYVADQAPERHLAPPPTNVQRYRLQSWLSFLGSEVHKLFGALFMPQASEEMKKLSLEALHRQFEDLNAHLSGRDYLLGKDYTVADSYLFTILGWPRYLNLDMSKYAALGAYAGRIAPRPAVQAALKAEGLA
jgi:glutathione S-transferase